MTGWFFWALLSAVFAATTAILAKTGLRGADPDVATLVRTAIILLAATLFVLVAGKGRLVAALPGRSWLFLSLSGLATAASWLCYFRALKLGDVARVAPVDKLSLVLVALFAVIFLGERPGGRDWFAIALVAAGTVLLALRR
ncbi:MAG: EamA family transporter [Planctomycetes bacterium]|nr:EamA family transporter [Planctomycetota bacterium]